jgi:hypothetical protein
VLTQLVLSKVCSTPRSLLLLLLLLLLLMLLLLLLLLVVCPTALLEVCPSWVALPCGCLHLKSHGVQTTRSSTSCTT